MKTYKIKPKKWIPINQDIEIELSEQEVEELIKQYGNIAPTHKRKYFVPKVGEEYYYINLYSEVKKSYYSKDDIVDIHNMETGNRFETFKDAQDELNRRQAIVRLWNNYDDKYSWNIDWEDSIQPKHFILYDYSINKLDGTFTGIRLYNTELPYFKSAEDRNQFVESNMEDLLKIFNIKK